MISLELLRRFPYFAGLSVDQLVTMAKTAKEETAPEGHFFFHEGDHLNNIYIVLEGEVAVLIELPAKDREIIVSTVGPGHVFSWSGLVSPFQSSAAAKSVSACRVLAFDCEQLRKSFEEDYQLGYLMMQWLAQVMRDRIRDARIETLACMM